MAQGRQKAYCISCGEDVPVNVVDVGVGDKRLLQCVHCLSYLGTEGDPQSASSPGIMPPRAPEPESPGEFSPDETATGGTIMPDLPKAMETPDAAGGALASDSFDAADEFEEGGPPLETVMTVEDSSLISAILNDMLVEQGLAGRVVPSKNGYEFLARYIRERKTPHNIGLVVMDVKMPVLNGISSSVAMRAHEKALDLEPVPLMFFTSKRCDETFRKVLMHTAPAMYINKGASSSPAQLQERIQKVIKQLLREEW